jgi:hypothetical protein
MPVPLFQTTMLCPASSAWVLYIARSGSISWNYTRFLDYCADRIFLRKVGGGDIFVYRILMEYFASLDTSQFSEEAPAQKSRSRAYGRRFMETRCYSEAWRCRYETAKRPLHIGS